MHNLKLVREGSHGRVRLVSISPALRAHRYTGDLARATLSSIEPMPTTSLTDNDKPNEPDTDDDDDDGGKDDTRSAWPVAYEWGVSQETQLEEAIAEAERQGGADPALLLLADKLIPSPVRQAIVDGMKRAKDFAVRANKRPVPSDDDGAIPTQACARGCTTADGARLPANLPVIGVEELEALVDKKEAAKKAWLQRVDEQLLALHVEPPGTPHNDKPFPVVFTGKGSCVTTLEQEALLKCFIKPKEWCKPARDVKYAPLTHTMPVPDARSLHCSQGTLFTTTACTVCATGWLWPKQASQRLQSLGCASASLEMLAS